MLYANYDVTGAGLSSALWDKCPLDRLLTNPGVGYGFVDDFVRAINVAAGAEAVRGVYKGFADTGGLVADSDEIGGVLNFSSDGDNEGASLATVMLPFQVDIGQGELWFEARFKTSTITDTKHGIVVGLIDAATLSATVPIAADGTLADEDFIGFHRLEGDGDTMDTVYAVGSVATPVTVKADALTLTVDTFYKVGLHFNPRDGNKLEYWFNGAKLPDTVTVPAADGVTFPNDVRLGLIFAVLNATGTTPGSSDLDWWACAQLRV